MSQKTEYYQATLGYCITDKKAYWTGIVGCVLFIPAMTVFIILQLFYEIFGPLNLQLGVTLTILFFGESYGIYFFYYIIQSKVLYMNNRGLYFDDTYIPREMILKVKLMGDFWLLRTYWLLIKYTDNSKPRRVITVVPNLEAEEIYIKVKSLLK